MEQEREVVVDQYVALTGEAVLNHVIPVLTRTKPQDPHLDARIEGIVKGLCLYVGLFIAQAEMFGLDAGSLFQRTTAWIKEGRLQTYEEDGKPAPEVAW